MLHAVGATRRRSRRGDTIRAVPHHDDDHLIREMLAPDVEQSLEALGFWLRRYDGLAAYRLRARAEARRKIRYWEGRVVADLPRAPLATLSCARPAIRVAGDAAAFHLRRAAQRTAVVGLGLAAVILVAAR